MVIESVAASDCGDSEVALTGVGDQLQGLAIPGWLRLLQETTSTLLQLIHRIKVSQKHNMHTKYYYDHEIACTI